MEATNGIFHCQICGREIKAGRGKIAKHGYKVLYGSFTNSCSGANFAPYEVSCERLEQIIERVKGWLADWASNLEELTANPPEKIMQVEQKSVYSQPVEKTYERPENFQAGAYGSNIPNTYANAYGNKMRELQRNIKLATQDIEYMESRAAGWHKEHDAPALEEVTSQPAPVQEEETGAAAALEASPIEVGDIVRPSVLYCPFATWTRAKVIGLNFYDNVDGKWVIDIQFMNGLELSQTKQYLMALWEVELVERSAQTSDLDRELEAIETRKREKIAALKAEDFTGYEEALDKQLNVGCTDTQKVWIQAARALVVDIMECSDCIKEICKIHSAASDSFPPYPG